MEQPQRPWRNRRGGRHTRPNSRSWYGRSVLLLPPPLLLILPLLLIPFAHSQFIPADNYLLNCGATGAATLDDDGRSFVSDSPSALPPPVSVNFDGSEVLTNPTTSAPALYLTARSFTRSSSYIFRITNTTSTQVVRLHFYPFSASLSSSTFSVSISGQNLLSGFRSESSSGSSSLPIIKEFFLKPGRDTLTLSFSPDPPSTLAFVNAIELFSAPSALVPPKATLLRASALSAFSDLDKQVLETLYRVNVGGLKVTPSNDTLWRTWLPDDASGVYDAKSGGDSIQTTAKINYQDGGVTKEVAPDWVYNSARAMYKANNSTAGSPFNVSWSLKVDPGQDQLLVRLHYCDIVSTDVNQIVFVSYINSQTVSEVDITTKAAGMLASPYYEDTIVGAVASGTLTVAVGPSTNNRSKTNALLNGIEVWSMKGPGKFSDSGGQKKKTSSVGIIIGAAAGAIVLLGIIAAIAFFLLRKKKDTEKKPNRPAATPPRSYPTTSWPSITDPTERGSRLTERSDGTPLHINFELRIPYDIILAATNSFDKQAQIGSGGFGKVYKGRLSDGRTVAVKRGKLGSQHGQQQFQSEILILSKTRHRHLVTFIGYCEERGEMILVYEFMEKGTLQGHLYGSDNVNPSLSWKQRLQILIGSAQGLDYLHTGQEPGIIHRDVKSANILLDGNYVAKVADFGISKLGPAANSAPSSANNTGTSVVKGTFGYLDPEYFRTQQLTNKSDVYSFGVVLVEVACARPALVKSLPDEEVSLSEWGLKWIKLGKLSQIVDPRIRDEIDPNSLRTFASIAEKCLASHGDDRPTMNDVLWNLNYALNLQETSMRGEPIDDSIVGSSVANVSIVRDFPIANPRRAEGNGPRVNPTLEAADLSSSTSNVFSQLINKEGR